MDLNALIRTVPDFPKPGIQFKDITTVLKDPKALAYCIDRFAEHYQGTSIDTVIGIESRGFILGPALALRLGAGFVPVRKPGKLPAATLRREYQLEYGTDAMEVHRDAVTAGSRVLLHDDVLATGGTMNAAAAMVQELGGTIAGISFIIELDFLSGRKKLPASDIFSLVHYSGE